MQTLISFLQGIKIKRIFLSGISGAGKSFFLDSYQGHSVSLDDFGFNLGDTWLFDPTKAKIPPKGDFCLAGTCSNLSTVFEACDFTVMVYLMPSYELFKLTQLAKFNDSSERADLINWRQKWLKNSKIGYKEYVRYVNNDLLVKFGQCSKRDIPFITILNHAIVDKVKGWH